MRSTLATVLALALLAAAANAAPISIDFDSNNVVQSGEPTHNEGMTLPGQVGDWHKLSTPASGVTGSVTIGDVTFRLNTNNTTSTKYRDVGYTGSLVRGDFFYLNAGWDPADWELTGLTPNGIYDIICYGRYNPNHGGYRGGGMSVNGGVVQTKDNGKDTSAIAEEGDWNFEDVTADGTGRIYGTLSHVVDGFAEFAGIQFQEIPEPATMALVGLGGLVMLRRRRA